MLDVSKTNRSSIMCAVLVVAALISLGVGAYSLTQATMGAGIVAAGCLLGVLARIAQAGHHQRQLLDALFETSTPES